MSVIAEGRPAIPAKGDPIRLVARGPVALRTSTIRITRAVRLLLAIVALLALFADPAQAVRYPAAAYALLIGYLVMAAKLLALSFVPAGRGPRLALGAHVLDLLILSALNFVTAGSTSPFFLLLTFTLLNATIRWRWRGALASGSVLLIVFFALALLAGDAAEPERDRVIVRAGYLVSLTLMLAVMGSYQERLSSELSRLAAPEFPPTSSLDAALSALLAYAAGVFQAPRAILAWSEEDEPWLHVLDWSAEATGRHREPPDRFEPLVPDTLSDKSFWAPAARGSAHTLAYQPGLGYFVWDGTPIAPGFNERFRIGAALSAPIASEGIQGRLFILIAQEPDPEDLLLLNVVARQAVGYVAQVQASERERQQSTIAERLRLARDLHDGILQFLTGIGLQLESISRTRHSPAELGARLSEVQRLISAQQQEVRGFVQTLKPILASRDFGRASLRLRLEELTSLLVPAWRLDIQSSVEPPDLEVPARLADEIVHLVSEAVANAARHGGANSIVVRVQARNGTLLVKIADDGSGLGFFGRYNASELAERQIGPLMLRQRVLGLGGLLEIESGPAGATIEIVLPLDGQ